MTDDDAPVAAGDRVADAAPPAGDRLAAVACEGADALALFALDTGDRIGEVPVGSHPVHATAAAGRTLVATMGERAVTAVAPDGEVTRIDTGVLGPSHFAAADDLLFVSCSAGDALAAIDPVESTLVDRVAVGGEPHEVAVAPGGDYLYAGSRRDGVVDVVDAAARERIASVDVGAAARVQGVALSPDGDRGYAIDQRGNRIVGFDPASATDVGNGSDREPASDAVFGSAGVGGDPYDLVATDDRVLVPGREDGTLHEFGPDLETVAVHEGFSRPVDAFRIDGDWWVLDAADARVRSLGGDAVETSAPGLVATRVGDRLLVSHYDDDQVSLVDVETGPVWTAESPAHPFGSVVV
ncbi:YncE family protein [Halorubrum pallidum]